MKRIAYILLLLLLPAAQIQAEKTLTVLTWNTYRLGNFKKPAQNKVLQYLMSQDADVICLQEVDIYKNNKYLTLAEVKQVLSKKYRYSYLDFAVYDKRHQFGTMVWSRYPLIHKESIHYETRGNLSNRCDIVIGEDTVRLFNNHLESYSFTAKDLDDMNQIRAKWKRAIPLRNKQAQVVRKEIEASPYPVIVLGDFNSIALSFAYMHISRGLHDAWRELHPWSWGATCEHRGIGLRIDYILCSDPLVPVQCTIPDAPGSDHKPVVATLRF